MSQGFNPRPKIVFTLALALGIEGRDEVVEIELAEPMEPDQVLERLRATTPQGLEWLAAEALGPGRAAQPNTVSYQIQVPADRQEEGRQRLASFLASSEFPYTRHRPDRTMSIDLRPFLLEAELDPLGLLRFRMKMLPSGSARPEEILDALGLRDLLGLGAVLVRTELELVP